MPAAHPAKAPLVDPAPVILKATGPGLAGPASKALGGDESRPGSSRPASSRVNSARPGMKTGSKHLAEPAMHAPPPSMTHAQDASHILQDVFMELYSNDEANEVPIDRLDRFELDPFVARIKRIQQRKEEKLEQARKVELFLMQAQRDLEAADNAEMKKQESALGIPMLKPVTALMNSHFLEDNGLLSPLDYVEPRQNLNLRPHDDAENPAYMENTAASSRRKTVTIEKRQTMVQESRDTYGYAVGKHIDGVEDGTDFGGRFSMVPGGGFDDSHRGLMTTQVTQTKAGGSTAVKPQQKTADNKTKRKAAASATAKRANAAATLQRPQTPSSMKPTVSFKSLPAELVYTDYKIGDVIEAVVKVINTSGSSQSLRVLPPKSTSFTAAKIRFAGQHEDSNYGRVAAGMSCECKVSFIAESLADYRSELTFVPEHGDKITVPLVARRPPPALGLPATMDAGGCAVQSSCSKVFQCKNTGARGRCRFITKDEALHLGKLKDLTEDFWTVKEATLIAGPFAVSPPLIVLETGETSSVEVQFSGTDVGRSTELITMVVDNGTSHDFNITASCDAPVIRLVGLTGGFKQLERLGGRDYNAVFNDVYPGVPAKRSLTIANDSKLSLPFTWVWPKGEEAEEHQEDTPLYTITPRTGVLAPNQSTEFALVYATEALGTSSTDAKLELDGFDDDSHFSLGLAGSCQPYEVSLSPPFLPMAGKLALGRSHAREVQVVNGSETGIRFVFESIRTPEATVTFQPENGMVSANSSSRVQVIVTPRMSGFISETIHCHVSHGPVLPLRLEVEIDTVEVRIDAPSVDFGLIKLGETVTAEIPIKNFSAVPVAWNFVAANGLDASQCTFHPPAGQLEAFGAESIMLTYKPESVGNVEAMARCIVGGGPDQLISVSAAVQRPVGCVLEANFDLGEGFKDLAINQPVILRNLSALPTPFLAPPSTSSEGITISFEPSSGLLDPHEELELEASFTSDVVGKVSHTATILLDGAEGPGLGVTMSANVAGASVLFTVDEPVDVTSVRARTAVPAELLELENSGAKSTEAELDAAEAELGATVLGSTVPSASTGAADSKLASGATAAEGDADAGAGHSLAKPIKVDFGDVTTFSIGVTKQIRLRNTSAVPVDLSFSVLGFPAVPVAKVHGGGAGAGTHSMAMSSTFSGKTSGVRTAAPPGTLSATGAKGGVVPVPPSLNRTGVPSFLRSTRRASSPARRGSGRDSTRGPPLSATRDRVYKPYGKVDMVRLEREQQQRAAEALKAGNGAAFEVTPSTLHLHPDSEEVITITCYSDTWGEYTDILRCESAEIPTKDIAIVANVIGKSMMLQTGGKSQAFPVIRLPQVTTRVTADGNADQQLSSGPETCTAQQTMKVTNPCPFDLICRWESYFVDPNSEQLVDFLCYPTDDVDECKVRSRVHEGTRTDKPFSVVAGSTNVALGRDRNMNKDSVTIKFESNTPGEFLGLVRGVATMSNLYDMKVSKAIEGDAATATIGVDRTKANDDQTEMRFYVTATAVEPRLEIPDDTSAFKFDPQALLNNNAVHSSVDYVVTNPTQASISTKFSSSFPFSVGKVECEGLTYEADEFVTLKPGSNAKITADVKLTVAELNKMTLDIVKRMEKDAGDTVRDPSGKGATLPAAEGTSEETCIDSAVLKRDGDDISRPLSVQSTFEAFDTDHTGIITMDEFRLAIRAGLVANTMWVKRFPDLVGAGEDEGPAELVEVPDGVLRVGEPLTATFSDGRMQEFNLLADVPVTYLAVHKTEIDFGTCVVGTSTTKEVRIANLGLSFTAWDLQSSQDYFACEPATGILEGCVSRVAANEAVVAVAYSPPSDGYFEATLTLTGRLGEDSRQIRIYGQGTYDEA